MNRRYNTEDFDENGILRDGHSVRVSMTARDSLSPMQRAVLDTRRALDTRVTDAAAHRPGYRFADVSNDARQQAYDAYQREAEEAWRNPPGLDEPHGVGTHWMGGAQEGSVCTVRGAEYPDDYGSPGHMRMVRGQMICVPDEAAKSRIG